MLSSQQELRCGVTIASVIVIGKASLCTNTCLLKHLAQSHLFQCIWNMLHLLSIFQMIKNIAHLHSSAIHQHAHGIFGSQCYIPCARFQKVQISYVQLAACCFDRRGCVPSTCIQAEFPELYTRRRLDPQPDALLGLQQCTPLAQNKRRSLRPSSRNTLQH